jgi:NAD(P)-dependent dehydrogenase (short-subunit alcohol dehydrogenase family)
MKTFLLIGGSTGIGYSLMHELLESGNKVLMASRNAPDIEHVNFTHYAFDVLQDDFSLLTTLGPLDGLIYLPGSIALKPLGMLKEEDFRSDMELNFFSLVKTVKTVANQLNQGASLLFFSSVAATTGMPFHTSIAAAKSAIEGFAKALAAENAPKWRVNVIAPSLTDTPLAGRLLSNDKKRELIAEKHPLKRVGSAQEIAQMAHFLISDKAGWITGQVIGIDGGKSTLSI